MTVRLAWSCFLGAVVCTARTARRRVCQGRFGRLPGARTTNNGRWRPDDGIAQFLRQQHWKPKSYSGEHALRRACTRTCAAPLIVLLARFGACLQPRRAPFSTFTPRIRPLFCARLAVLYARPSVGQLPWLFVL